MTTRGPGPRGETIELTPTEQAVLRQSATPEGTFRACLTYDRTLVVDVNHQQAVERLLALGLVTASGEGTDAVVRVTASGRAWLDGAG